MGQMLLRHIDDQVLADLKAQAKANHRSAEAEMRTILTEAMRPKARDEQGKSRRTLASMVGSGSSSTSFKTSEEIVAHVRALRDEWER